MKRFTILSLAMVLLAGCATAKGPEQISFDRAAFALTYGKLSQAVATKCAAKELTETECAALREIDRGITRQILTPAPAPSSSSVDMEALMKFLIGAAKFAM